MSIVTTEQGTIDVMHMDSKEKRFHHPGLAKIAWRGLGREMGWLCLVLGALLLSADLSVVRADDWPQWLGPQRDGVWRETGIVAAFPKDGPTLRWRTPIGVRQRRVGPSFGNAATMPVSRQTPSRCGPSHCGQSS